MGYSDFQSLGTGDFLNRAVYITGRKLDRGVAAVTQIAWLLCSFITDFVKKKSLINYISIDRKPLLNPTSPCHICYDWLAAG